MSEDLKKLELIVDEHYRTSLPAFRSKDEALIYLCLNSEDRARMALVGVSGKSSEAIDEHGAVVAFSFVNSMKIGLQQALKAINCLPLQKIDPRYLMSEKLCSDTYEYIDASIKYGMISGKFISCYQGGRDFQCDLNELVLTTTPNQKELAYLTLDGLLSVFREGSSATPINDFFNWLHFDNPPFFIKEAIAETKVVRDRIQVKYHTGHLIKCMQASALDLLPEEWQLPWGVTGKEAKTFASALAALALYHLSVVHFRGYKRVDGSGCNDICIIIGRNELARTILSIADISKEQVYAMIDALTYGNKTDSPDPALQPLIPCQNVFIIPPLMILTSNFDRNLLTLNSRTNKKSFNDQSSIFEKRMMQKMANSLTKSCSWQYKFNQEVRSQICEEIDLLFLNPGSKSILLIEARWMLQPAETREVLIRRAVCEEKVQQIKRKVTFARRNLNQLLSLFGLKENGDQSQWNIDGIVVLDQYSGCPSSENDVPIMPIEVFLYGINGFSHLPAFFAWAKSLTWLPKVPHIFEVQRITEKFGPVSFESDEAAVSANWGKYVADLESSIKSFQT